MKKNILLICLICIVIFGLTLRYYGIQKNLSYWNDEGYVAVIARGILEYGKPITPNGAGTGIYQAALYFITAISFKIFGITEFAGRFPSVIVGSVIIFVGFQITKKLFSERVALFTALLLSLSQIQIAWSTQLRPYIWLELFTISIIYFLYEYLVSSKNIINKYLHISLLISIISFTFHGTGLVNLALIGIVFIYKIIREKKYIYMFILPFFGILGIYVIYNSVNGGWIFVKDVLLNYYFSPLHYRIFLTHNYYWLIIGTFIGSITLFKRNKELAILMSGSIIFIFLVAVFKVNPNYVRYSLPAFPLMYILFAEGVVSVTDRVAKKKYVKWMLITLVVSLLYSTDKIIIWPRYYYSINADVRENPIVDYKLTFSKIGILINNKKNVLVLDSWNDRVPLYMPEQKYVFVNKSATTEIDPIFGEEMVNNLEKTKEIIASYSAGIVIVEDWESLMGEDIKEYVRKNLKFEFTIQDLPYNENDHWGISVYSWGI